MSDLLIRRASVDGGAPVDIAIAGGRIAAIGRALPIRGPALDAAGGGLIPGLADHHIHLLATAARRASIVLDGVGSPTGLAVAIARAARERPAGTWLRATGYDEAAAGLLDADRLEALAPRHPLRVLDRTGALWTLNRSALAKLPRGDHDAIERGIDGRPTGRVWRGDAWLREAIGSDVQDLGPIGAELARYGVTHLTDASATTDAAAADILGVAHLGGAMPQHLMLMSAGALPAGPWRVGPVKLLLDERALPALDAVEAVIAFARRQGRCVAVHCVTAAELALSLAAFTAAGTRPGDRIEHGSVIPAEAIPQLAALGLQVVTQPAFLHDRGDRYRRTVDRDEQRDLYRVAGLLRGGVRVAASSDAPYATLDPWIAMRAAINRRTRAGHEIAPGERVPPMRALGLYLGGQADPGGDARRVAVGEPADLCLLSLPVDRALATPDAANVAATIIAGRIAYAADPAIRVG